MGDLEEVLAVLQTAIVLARNLSAPLSLKLPGKDIFQVDLGKSPSSPEVSRLLDSTRVQLGRIAAPAFIMEVNLVAASFVRGGSITMHIRRANEFALHRQP